MIPLVAASEQGKAQSESGAQAFGIVGQASLTGNRPRRKSPWKGVPKRVRAPLVRVHFCLNVKDVRVVLLGIAVRIGSYTSAKAKYDGKTDSEQVA